MQHQQLHQVQTGFGGSPHHGMPHRRAMPHRMPRAAAPDK